MKRLHCITLILGGMLFGCTSTGDSLTKKSDQDLVTSAKAGDSKAYFALAYKNFEKFKTVPGLMILREARRIHETQEGLKDFPKAVEWVKQNAEKGNPIWQDLYGHLYLEGIGVPRSEEEYLKWIRKSAEQGYANAQYDLCDNYSKNQSGFERDYTESVKWCRKAIEKDHPDAYNKMALFYIYGAGVPKDMNQAIAYLEKAVAKGSRDAEYNLANKYYTGEGVAKDYKKAFMLLKDASEKGNFGAMSNLSHLYYKGHGVEKDIAFAYAWTNVSAMYGIKAGIENRQALEAEMTTEQIQRGQTLSKEIISKYGLSKNNLFVIQQ